VNEAWLKKLLEEEGPKSALMAWAAFWGGDGSEESRDTLDDLLKLMGVDPR